MMLAKRLFILFFVVVHHVFAMLDQYVCGTIMNMKKKENDNPHVYSTTNDDDVEMTNDVFKRRNKKEQNFQFNRKKQFG